MTLNNIKQMKKQKGFTIVELLIVIVIIGILAALVIVAYNGIQNRAKAAAGQNLANVIVKKAEAYNSINSSYPTFCQLLTNSTTSVITGTWPAGSVGIGTTTNGCNPASGTSAPEAKVDNVNTVALTSAAAGTGYTSTISNSNAVVGYFSCAAGANVFYWNYSATTPAIATVKAGAGC